MLQMARHSATHQTATPQVDARHYPLIAHGIALTTMMLASLLIFVFTRRWSLIHAALLHLHAWRYSFQLSCMAILRFLRGVVPNGDATTSSLSLNYRRCHASSYNQRWVSMHSWH
ncbi:hypothetical protein AMTR_s00112p00015020 [Amborella trichopoda]|uniref:Uncharacterized protein n=1 Tax=Amborella trichopoda TaxID=13333 RepID=W1NXM5_AMBTC|nr:hypothetical protein AMTR_s00112p00015020 [Amborella trichopoda]